MKMSYQPINTLILRRSSKQTSLRGLYCMCVLLCYKLVLCYSYLARSHLSLKIWKDHCDFPADYTPQLFNTFEGKWVCHVSHSEVVFFSLPLTHKHGNVTVEHTPLDQMFADHGGEYSRCFSCCVILSFGHSSLEVFFCFSLAQVFIVEIYWLLFVLCSHNTKTTTWLDPRLAKKAKPPEKCEDGGMFSAQLLYSSMQPFH